MIANVKSSRENIKVIQEQFNEVLLFSQGYKPDTDQLFEKWFEAKRDIIESWGGDLIVELPEKVSFELSQKEKDERLDEFIRAVDDVFDNGNLATFLEDNRAGFFKNKVVYGNEDIPVDMKLLKAFKYFESDPYILKELQTRASMIIQEDKVEGYLCFSVHPLDFLSSSENTYNWRSCHALDGEYRSGNLSYMMDSATIMCYLRGSEREKLPNFPSNVLWNNKKWRMLLFFSEHWDVMFAGRQYPFFSRTALDTVKNGLFTTNMLPYSTWSDWHDDQLKYFEFANDKLNYEMDGGPLMWHYICLAGELYPLNEVVIDQPHSRHFNDVLRSSCYTPFYCFRRYRPAGRKPLVKIGGEIPCCSCGCNYIATTDSMLCEECELDFGDSDDDRFGYCDLCERRILVDDGYFVESHGHLICGQCYEYHTTTCNSCARIEYSDEITYDKETHRYLCTRCNPTTYTTRIMF